MLVYLLDPSLKIQRGAVVGKATVFKAVLSGIEFVCYARLQVCLSARIPNQRDGLGIPFSDLEIHTSGGSFLPLLTPGNRLLSLALTQTPVRADGRRVSAGQGQTAEATHCHTVTHFLCWENPKGAGGAAWRRLG